MVDAQQSTFVTETNKKEKKAGKNQIGEKPLMRLKDERNF